MTCLVCGQSTNSDYLNGDYHPDCAEQLLGWIAELHDKPAWEETLSIIFKAIRHEQKRQPREQMRLLEV